MRIKLQLSLFITILCLLLTGCIAVPHEPVIIKPAPTVIKVKPRRVVAAPVSRNIKPAVRHYPTVVYVGHDQWQSESEAIQEQVDLGANFNEHYRVVTLSCGVNCTDNLIVDVDTGEIVDELRACGSAEFSTNSDILNIPERDRDGTCTINSYQFSQRASLVEVSQ